MHLALYTLQSTRDDFLRVDFIFLPNRDEDGKLTMDELRQVRKSIQLIIILSKYDYDVHCFQHLLYPHLYRAPGDD